MFGQWKHWIQVTSRLNYLEGSDDFAWACLCIKFRFHLGHPYCLTLCLRRWSKPGLKFALLSNQNKSRGWRSNMISDTLIRRSLVQILTNWSVFTGKKSPKLTQVCQIWSNQIVKYPAKNELFVKQYLCSVLDVSEEKHSERETPAHNFWQRFV